MFRQSAIEMHSLPRRTIVRDQTFTFLLQSISAPLPCFEILGRGGPQVHSIRRAEAKTLSMAKRALTTPGHRYTTHLQDCMRTRHTHTRARTYLPRPIVVTRGIKPSSNIDSALVSAMYGRSSELGLYGGQGSISLEYQTDTSAYLFDTLVSGLAQPAIEHLVSTGHPVQKMPK